VHSFFRSGVAMIWTSGARAVKGKGNWGLKRPLLEFLTCVKISVLMDLHGTVLSNWASRNASPKIGAYAPRMDTPVSHYCFIVYQPLVFQTAFDLWEPRLLSYLVWDIITCKQQTKDADQHEQCRSQIQFFGQKNYVLDH